jgi:ferredoxin--NADP+ reductase
VIGNGNVALDIARILARPASGFRQTDMADHAIEALEHSAITDVVVAARRGPEHAAYTTGELLALERTEGVTLLAADTEVLLGQDDADHRAAIVATAARRSPRDGERTITFRYGLTPASVKGNGKAESVTFRRADGTAETIHASLVIRAAGYHGKEVPGLPYDQASDTLPHRAGAVYDPATGLPVPGIYCVGWIKRGATGVIGSNKTDARESVETILADLGAGRLAGPRYDIEHLTGLVRSRQPEVISAPEWARIDEAERREGDAAGRPRIKFVHLSDLLSSARP